MKHLFRKVLTIALVAMVSLQVAATVTFISEVKVASTTTALTNEGYIAFDKDLNDEAGGEYIYLGYKTTTDPTQAITGLAIYVGETYADDTYLNHGIVASDNKVYYKAAHTGVGSNGDLNAGAGGEYLYLFYSKTGQHDASVPLITSIAIDGSGTRVSNKDLNSGAGGDYIYLTIEGTHTHNTDEVHYNGDGTHTLYCTSCGTYIGNAADACTITTTTTDTTHESHCTVCGNVTANGPHTFENGICTLDNCLEVPSQDAEGYYLVNNAGTLLWWNYNKHHHSTTENPGMVRFTADIDLNPGYVFASDGSYTAPEGARSLITWTPADGYSDVYIQGDGHTLKGLYSSGEDPASFCAQVYSPFCINNLIIRDSYFCSTRSYAAPFCSICKGPIANCAAINVIAKSNISRAGNIAGIVYGGGKITNGWSYCPNSTANYAVALPYGSNTYGTISKCVALTGTGDMTYTNSCTKEEFASGKAAWLANGGNSAGPWKQIIGVDSLPSFNGPSVYAVYDAEGTLTGYSNRSKGDIVQHGKATVADLTNLVGSLDASSGTYGNADVDGDGSLTLDDATLLQEMILGNDPFVEVSSISLDGNDYMMPNTKQTLTTTLLPADANLPYVSWTSSDESIATVSGGQVTALKLGTATITATALDGSGQTATFDVTVEPSYVDLGLPSGTLWATMNVGANSPEEYGGYYAWGETSTKYSYLWSTYKWCEGSENSLTKYCYESSYGQVDNLTELEDSDDAAWVNWGERWSTPTGEQATELLDGSYTSWVNTTQNGTAGFLITSRINGNTIFLPMAGYMCNAYLSESTKNGYYATRTNSPNCTYDCDVLYFGLTMNPHLNKAFNHCFGYSVRPVRRQKVESITLSSTSLDLTGNICDTLTASILPIGAHNKTLTWSSSNESVATVVDGIITIHMPGEADITATATDGSDVSSTCRVTVSLNANGHDYVDLGVTDANGNPVYFATMNIGASSPSGYGDYFAWGETTGYSFGKTNFTWSTYSLCEGTETTLTKYCTNSNYGTVDGLIYLEAEDDAATVNWGGNWRMPTIDELRQLGNCSWTWTDQGYGYNVTAPNGNSIFLPRAGSCYSTNFNTGAPYYRSCQLDASQPNHAYHLSYQGGMISQSGNRYTGMTIRAVLALSRPE